jgi:uncharacterized protein (DUF2252 family)
MALPSPVELAKWQLSSDRERMAKTPWLFQHKVSRMLASPFAFLRGAAPLFYEVLKTDRGLASGPGGDGWITGDLHLENFGCYRVDPVWHGSRVVFDVNDFDDATVAPWRWDMTRLGTSLLLAARGLGLSGSASLDLLGELLDTHRRHARSVEAAPPEVPRIQRLVEGASAVSHAALLARRTSGHGEKRRFVRGDHYRSISRALRLQVERAFARYAQALPQELLPAAGTFQVQDVAFRIAGTGSLGSKRFGILVHGKGGKDGAWMFDMKEQGEPSSSVLVNPPGDEGAVRVVQALRTCLAKPPLLAGVTTVGGRSMLVRRLAPQEEKLSLQGATAEELGPIVRLLAYHAAGVHRRGAKGKRPRWTDKDVARLVSNVVTLTGLHEATYLAYCALTRAP